MTVGTQQRATLISSLSMMNTADSDQRNVLAATEYLKQKNEEERDKVNRALAEVERYKAAQAVIADKKAYEQAQATIKNTKRDSDENNYQIDVAKQEVAKYEEASGIVQDQRAYNEALAELRSANAGWTAALTTLSDTNSKLLAKREKKSEVSSGTVMDGSTPNAALVDSLSPDQVRDQINLGINNLQLQIKTQQAMLAEDDPNYKAKMETLNAAQDALNEAYHAALDPAYMGSREGMGEVVDQLDSIQKFLTAPIAKA